LAIAGEPGVINMPAVWGVHLTGHLPDWVSAKDVILEMLRRHKVTGGKNKIIEYWGPGVRTLDAMSRHVIANMGAELGATTSVFPSDERTLEFLKQHGRERDWKPLAMDEGARFDENTELDLSKLEPLIAMPSSPDKVFPVISPLVRDKPIYQSYIGSSANPGFRDFAIASAILEATKKKVAPTVSLDITPTSRDILEDLTSSGHLRKLIHGGGRIHQAGCGGCIGMGAAPATGRISLRTVPRNFPGRSGTEEDAVYLCSPETAIASAITGKITDPRDLGIPYPKVELPKKACMTAGYFIAPQAESETKDVQLEMGPNIKALPIFPPLPLNMCLPVLLKVGDNVSTDEILPAGASVLPYRSNIPKIAEFTFWRLQPDYWRKGLAIRHAEEEKLRKTETPSHADQWPKNSADLRNVDVSQYRAACNAAPDLATGGHVVIGGSNYGQGSSREHAALAPRYLGLQAVVAKSFARIHWQNLANHGILALEFANASDYDSVKEGDALVFRDLHTSLRSQHGRVPATLHPRGEGEQRAIELCHSLSERQLNALISGGFINYLRQRQAPE
jgi:aconitate hydratase